MSARIPFEDLIVGLRTRDSAAVRELLERYTDRLIAVVNLKMPAWLKAREGPEDIAQTVLKTVVRRVGNGQLTADSDDGLWRLLVRVAARKVAHRYRDQTAQKRGGGRERSLGCAGSDEAVPVDLVAASGPTPDEQAEFGDTVEWLMRKLGKPKYQEVVRLALLGHAREEIADTVGLEVRQVFRILADVRQRLEQRLDGAERPGPEPTTLAS